MKTESKVRKAFWENHPEFKAEFKRGKRQNDYNATIGTAFALYVDYLRSNGEISQKLAQRVTL